MELKNVGWQCASDVPKRRTLLHLSSHRMCSRCTIFTMKVIFEKLTVSLHQFAIVRQPSMFLPTFQYTRALRISGKNGGKKQITAYATTRKEKEWCTSLAKTTFCFSSQIIDSDFKVAFRESAVGQATLEDMVREGDLIPKLLVRSFLLLSRPWSGIRLGYTCLCEYYNRMHSWGDCSPPSINQKGTSVLQ